MPCCSATSRRPEVSICCAETYLNVALGQAEGEQIEKLQGTKESTSHKYVRKRKASTGQEHRCLKATAQHWLKKQNKTKKPRKQKNTVRFVKRASPL